MKKKASEALAGGMPPSAVYAFVSLGRYELDCEIPMPAPTPPPPKNEESVPVQFPVCWGEEYRAAPNALFRSALFPALSNNEKENRRFVKKEEVFSVAGLTVVFTGQQFDQSDLDIYLEILNFAKHQNMGTVVKFTAYSMLKALGLTNGYKNHEHLHDVIIRLRGGTLEVTDHKKRYMGGFLEGIIRDEITLEYEVIINPRFAVLFGFDMYSKLNIEKQGRLCVESNVGAGESAGNALRLPQPQMLSTICFAVSGGPITLMLFIAPLHLDGEAALASKKIGPLERLAIPAKHCAVNDRKIDVRPLRRHMERGLDKFTYRL